MGCKYLDQEIAVLHGVVRGVRVRDLKHGRVIQPPIDLLARTLTTWTALPKVKFSSRRARTLAESALFRDCGRLTLQPNDPRALTLLMLSGSALVEHYWRIGEMDYLSEQH